MLFNVLACYVNLYDFLVIFGQQTDRQTDLQADRQTDRPPHQGFRNDYDEGKQQIEYICEIC